MSYVDENNASLWTHRNTALRRQKSLLDQSVVLATLQPEIDEVISSLKNLQTLQKSWAEWERESQSPLVDAERVEKLERIANENAQQTLLLNQKVERLLCMYQNMMRTLSLKLIQADTCVECAENKYSDKAC